MKRFTLLGGLLLSTLVLMIGVHRQRGPSYRGERCQSES